MNAVLAALLIVMPTGPLIEWYGECANGHWGNPDGSWCIYRDGDGNPRLYPGWFNE